MREKFKIQSDQYQFPYHYLVDPRTQDFGKHLAWGLDYYTYMNKVISLVKRYATTDLLDVGCGDGFMLYHLAQDPEFDGEIRAVGVDVDEKPIKFAQAFAHGLPNVSFHARDIATYEEKFRLITVVETFEHIPGDRLDGFIANIDRLLHDGGHLIVSVPSKVRPVIEKHYRHYDLDMLRGYFPDYDVRETHYVSDRNSLLYQVISLLLCSRHVNLNFGSFKKGLLALHERFTSETTADRGAHIVTVFQKL